MSELRHYGKMNQRISDASKIYMYMHIAVIMVGVFRENGRQWHNEKSTKVPFIPSVSDVENYRFSAPCDITKEWVVVFT